MSIQSMIFVFVMIFFKCSLALSPRSTDFWVVWNIGQGQWVTHVLTDQCRHYDMGGEMGSMQRIKKSVLQNCGQKNNRLYLSHWDFDHILNIPLFSRLVPSLCWAVQPKVQTRISKSVQKILDLKLQKCALTEKITMWIPQRTRTSNDGSYVYLDQTMLLPGDSTTTQEKIWTHELKSLEKVKILVLGHHGSRTSTGFELLKRLKNLKMTVASARYRKYHHPHFLTLKRVRAFDVPVLKTEDWGNLIF